MEDGPRRRTTRGALLGWAAIAAAVWPLSAFAPSAAAGGDAGEAVADEQLGATIYASQCAQCHGADGNGGLIEGTDEPAPALAGVDRVTVPYVDLVLRTGRMPPPGDPFDNRARQVDLNDEERQALVAYVQEAFGIPGAVPEVRSGDAATGREVFAANCAQCHGSAGAGGVAGAGAWTPQVSDYGPVVLAEAVRVGPFEMPAFGPEVVSDAEIGDIAAFLAAVREEPQTPLGLVELNPVFAAAGVALLSAAVVASLLWIAGRPQWFPDPVATTPPPEPAEEAS